MVVTITLKASNRLLQDPESLLQVLGELAVSFSQGSFDQQSFDGKKWPERYPRQSGDGKGPFLNIAGALADLSERGSVREIQLHPIPALVATGALRQSIAAQVLDDKSVEVGSDLPYANLQQKGGETDQPITPTARTALKQWLGGAGKPFRKRIGWMLAVKKGTKRKGSSGERVRLLASDYMFDALHTRVGGRQFIGVTKTLEKDLARAVEDYAKGLDQ